MYGRGDYMAASASGPTVVLDNGGCTLKAGFAGKGEPAGVLPNCTVKPKGDKRLYIADELDDCHDISALTIRRPVEKGFVINWPLERDIWDRTFRRLLKVDPQDCSLLVTEPLFNLPALMGQMDEVIFETYGFSRALVTCAPLMASYDPKSIVPGSPGARARAAVVLDAGFSYTYAVPVFDGRVFRSAARRVNLGGKALTNYLKEVVSYRSMNMMDEFVLMERIKEQLCYVAGDMRSEIAEAKKPRSSNKIAREYVLPDGVSILRGYVKARGLGRGALRDVSLEEPVVKGDDAAAAVGSAEEADDAEAAAAAKRQRLESQRQAGGPSSGGKPGGAEQVLQLCNERFLVPEAIFHPTDIGLNQAGIAEAVVAAVKKCPPDVQELLYGNVIVTGGTAALPGFDARLLEELRPLVPDQFQLGVRRPPKPELAAWRGAAAFAATPAFDQVAMTREEYFEKGPQLRAQYAEHPLWPPRGRLW